MIQYSKQSNKYIVLMAVKKDSTALKEYKSNYYKAAKFIRVQLAEKQHKKINSPESFKELTECQRLMFK